ncbi:MAG TPA: ABC transporter ATP-binding protein [Gemmatimonadales bacterium]|nr:ABC transporter ATP-binding protein [Gemmatimonadales bacterium]
MDALIPLAMEQVGFAYGSHSVLEGVSLRVNAGEGVALLGANGAGKTTLTRLAMALLHPDAGQVTTVGRHTTGRGPEDLAGAVGYLFQHPEAQLFARTVHAEVAFGPERLGWSAERIRTAVDATLEELELAALAAHHPYDLPQPTRRLVALAAALVAGPHLLILDEPTAGLDRAARARVTEIVLARRAAGTAILAVTHDMEFAAAALDRAVVLVAKGVARDLPLPELLGRHPDFPAPPLLELARRLGLEGVRPTAAALAPLLTSRPQTGTLEA